MGKLRNAFFVLLTVQLIFTGGCSKIGKKQIADDSSKKQELQSIDIFGKATSSNIININIDFPAKIEKVYIKEGQRVNLGDPLVSLIIRDFESQIASKEIELDSAKFELQSDLLEQQKLTENLNPSESELEKTEAVYESKKRMFEQGIASKKDVDDAESEVNSKKQILANIKISLKKLNSNNNSIEIKRNKIKNLENSLLQLKDKINIKNFRRNIIISDIKNGIVYDIGYSSGDIIMPSLDNKKILSILDTDSMIVQADVPEEFIKDIKVGSKVVINPAADTLRKYNGTINRISSMAVKKNNETIIPIDIIYDNSDDFIRPNFNVDVKVMIENK
jgi:HlyD family secretion protein